MDALIFENVNKNFGPVRAVDSVSSTVPAGCIYGLLGPNGAGKTTLIRMIMNIMRPDSGKITILGKDSNSADKTKTSYMPEERGLYRKMTAAKTLGYFGSIKGLSKSRLAEKIPYWLEKMYLTDWADKKVEELSRGMHQKLQFATVAINEPELLILDEPFSGLDPVNLDTFKGLIRKIRDEGKTVVLSTHMMQQAEELCDYIMLINKGRAVINGPLDQIRSQSSAKIVSIETSGDNEFIKTLPIVVGVAQNGRTLDITLAETAQPQQLLKAIIDRLELYKFEVKRPSLHEIFVGMVKEKGDVKQDT